MSSLKTNKNLDSKHNEIIDYLKNKKNEIPNYKIQINELNLELDNMNDIISNETDIIKIMDIRKKIWNLENQIEELNKKIMNIEDNTEEEEYLLNTGDILLKYYDNSQSVVDNKTINILELFSSDKSKYNLVSGKEILKLKNNNKNKSEKVERISRKKLYEKYNSIISDNYIPRYNEDNIIQMDICPNCNIELNLDQASGSIVCTGCGSQEKIIIDSDKPSYKDPPKELTSFCYKRINHLNEFLAQFQAKETTEIPDEIYNKILNEIKKQRITNMADLTTNKLKDILKKINHTDYYEHRAYIINQLNGLPPPTISPEVEEIIRNMFREIQIPFEKHKPQVRKNFLSYSYVMYKFFELLELDEYLHCFQLLKNRGKLTEQDNIWKKICNELRWEFIPSL